MPRGENGHLAAKHVVMETERGVDFVLNIVTMSNQVIYCAMKPVTRATVSFLLSFLFLFT